MRDESQVCLFLVVCNRATFAEEPNRMTFATPKIITMTVWGSRDEASARSQQAGRINMYLTCQQQICTSMYLRLFLI